MNKTKQNTHAAPMRTATETPMVETSGGIRFFSPPAQSPTPTTASYQRPATSNH